MSATLQASKFPVIQGPSLHEDRIEKLDSVFYIRWTSGPNYEDAYICVEDGEADMNDIARVGFKSARLFAEAYRFAQKLADANPKGTQ
jgi:hypothetical protein